MLFCFSFWLNNQNGGDYLFSVDGIARLKNNNIQLFYRQLKEIFQLMHKNLWIFLNKYGLNFNYKAFVK